MSSLVKRPPLPSGESQPTRAQKENPDRSKLATQIICRVGALFFQIKK